MGGCLGKDVSNKYAAGGAQNSQELVNSNSAMRSEAEQATALLTGSLAYCSFVELAISAQKLVHRDVMSKSDPMAVLFEKMPNGAWREVGRTEFITNSQNPTFVKRFRLMYNFEKVQEYRVLMVDVDTNQNPDMGDPTKMDQQGAAEFKLSEVVTAPKKALTRHLTKDANGPSVTLAAEEVSNAREVLTFQLAAAGLMNADMLSKSDPFVEIHRQNEDGSWVPVFKTEVVKDNLNPTWKPITIKATQLNNGDPHRPLKLRVLDFDSNGTHVLLGEADTTGVKLSDLSQAQGSLTLVNPQKAKAGASFGTLSVKSFKVEVFPTFIDYLQAGVEIRFTVAVDFTGSNGPPNHPNSLHYLNPAGGYTPYESAIVGIGRVLEGYDSDKQYPVLGFGGLKQGGVVEHCFPIGDCNGIEGILQAYRAALMEWGLSGPTLFQHCIKEAIKQAQQPSQHIRYQVLLILTDGAIMDMQETIDAIITASSLPISILIVGIGNSPELVKMEVLDADRQRLSLGNRSAVRDIVQFVHFNSFKGDGTALAGQLLAELPGQFLQYMRANNVPVPHVPQQAPPP